MRLGDMRARAGARRTVAMRTYPGFLPSLPFLLLACASAACSAAPGEDAQSSSDDLTFFAISHVHVTATESSVTVTYVRNLGGPFQVTLTGPGGTTTLPESTVSGSEGVVFSGLDECTPYTFAILSGGVTLQSGNIHTLQFGGLACPATETMAPDRGWQFEGAYHWRNNAPWCYPSSYSQGWRTFPLGEPGWVTRNGGSTVSVGYTHYWQPGAQPFPCQEQVVDVLRAMVHWKVDPSRVRRLQTATVHGTLTSPQLCVTDFAEMGRDEWSEWHDQIFARNDFNQTWSDVFGAGIETGAGLTRIGSLAPLARNGSTLSADVTASARVGGVLGGFAVTNDGFPIPNGTTPANTAFPEDNNSCQTGIDNVALTLAYNPITPDTPMNCAGTLYCDQFVVTCDAAPETFQVRQTVNGFSHTVATAQGSVSAPATVSGTRIAPVDLQVCTASGALSTCTGAIPVTVAETCNAGGGSSGASSGAGSGGGGCGINGKTCKTQ
jgi:hypothetical protein